MAETVDAYYRGIERAIEKIKLGYSHLCFVRGRPGIGKSHQIERCLRQFGLKYAEINGDVSEAYLYRVLCEHNGKVIWFKDVVRLLKGLRSLDLLKSACETKAERVIHCLTYSEKQQDLPKEFVFTGSLVFDFNSLTGLQFREDFEALTSRGDFIDVALSFSDISSLMRLVCKSLEERQVTEFLIDNYSYNGFNALNLRTQQRAFATYRYATHKGIDWRAEVRTELNNQRSRAQRLLYPILGDEALGTLDLKKYLVRAGIVSTIRTADRRIADWLELGDLYRVSDDTRNFLVALRPVVSPPRHEPTELGDTSDTGNPEASHPASASVSRPTARTQDLSSPRDIPTKGGVPT